MNNQINIAEILKDAPKGTKLFSPLCGECSLVGIKKGGVYPIVVAPNDCADSSEFLHFKENGNYQNYVDAECLLFPSKDCRDWENFKPSWKPDHKVFEPFQEVLVPKCCHFAGGTKVIWAAAIYSHYDEECGEHVTTHYAFLEDYEVIPYKGNEEKLGKEYEKED